MKKRFFYFIASCIMIGGILSGCANDEKPSNKTTEGTTIETEIVTEVDTKIEVDTETKTEVVPEGENESIDHEHTYTQKNTKEPTCDEKGVITYTCACGDSYTEETHYLDHCTDRSEITKKSYL